MRCDLTTASETDINRSYTPQTNQETQSSGSSGTRRRKGVFDDDDDYFLRENRVSNEIHLGDYISSAIKEGLSTPEANALVQMGDFDGYIDHDKREFTPERPIRSLKRKGKKAHDEDEDQVEEESWPRGHVGGFNDFCKTFPPDRPVRKQKKSVCESEDMGKEIDLSQHHQVPDSTAEHKKLIATEKKEADKQKKESDRLKKEADKLKKAKPSLKRKPLVDDPSSSVQLKKRRKQDSNAKSVSESLLLNKIDL
jgi:hypothetical protein